MKCLFSLFAFFLSIVAIAQQDSLDFLLNAADHNFETVEKLNRLVEIDIVQSKPSSLEVAKKAQKIVQSYGNNEQLCKASELLAKAYVKDELYGKAIATFQQVIRTANTEELLGYRTHAQYRLGHTYSKLSKFDSAIFAFSESLKGQLEQNDSSQACDTYINIGIMYWYLGDFDQVLNYYKSSLAIAEAIQDDSKLAFCNNNIAIIFDDMGNLERGEEYYRKAIPYYEKTGAGITLAKVYNNLGQNLAQQGKMEEAEELIRKSLSIRIEEKNEASIAYGHGSLANLLFKQGKKEESLEYYKKSHDYYVKHGNKQGMSSTFLRQGGIYVSLGNYEKAVVLLDSAYSLAMELDYKVNVANAARKLAKGYKGLNVLDSAYKYLEIALRVKDSLVSKENANKLAEMEALFNKEKQEKELKIKNLELEKSRAEGSKKTAIIWGFLGVLLLSFLAIYFIVKSLRDRKKANEILTLQKLEIETKNKEIIDSINYAKRIQSAILPPKHLVKQYLDNSFVLYKPKDIVAGDFYWMQPFSVGNEQGREEGVLFAVADCTGHGVPGAMVSVVCNNALNRCVREYGLRDPGQILDKARKIVVGEFEKSGEEVRDGMDIALCCLQGRTLSFAGAFNPLWIVRGGEVMEIKGNKEPIGKYYEYNSFTTHIIELEKGDTAYIFSDGFSDQFGGPKGKKFKAKNFKNLLCSIQDKTMLEQKKLIDNTFENWRNDLEQIDDVCVIGVRI